MFDKKLLSKIAKGYSEDELEVISKGYCPVCLPHRTPYRILETYYSEVHRMEVHRVKCADVVRCEWDEEVPTYRFDNGLEGFFES